VYHLLIKKLNRKMLKDEGKLYPTDLCTVAARVIDPVYGWWVKRNTKN
jgi:hypothetical protein